MIEAELRTYVLADPVIAAAVGSRMYPRVLPQSVVLPAIAYSRIDTLRQHHLDGADGLPRARFQVTAWAKTPLEAANVAHAVRWRLDGVSGALGGSYVGAIRCVGERDIDDVEAGRYGVALDFLIHYQEE